MKQRFLSLLHKYICNNSRIFEVSLRYNFINYLSDLIYLKRLSRMLVLVFLLPSSLKSQNYLEACEPIVRIGFF